VVDQVPVFAGGQVFNAVGNIGSGTRNTLQTNLIVPLDAVDWTGVTVKGDAVWRHSRVRDPATGLYRKIVGGQTLAAGLCVRDHHRRSPTTCRREICSSA
jgi:hypothetical protein